MTTPLIRVCGADDLAERAGALNPTHIVSLIPSAEAATLAYAHNARHTALPIPDRERAGEEPWAADAAHSLLALGATLTAEDRVLVHCMAGISRSTAAALLLDLGHHGGPHSPTTAANALDRLLAHRPKAMPNGSLLAAADRALGLNGVLSRLRAATIGRALLTTP